PPPEVYKFDSEWAKCTRWYTDGQPNGGFTFGLFDPPKMLTPVAMADRPSSTSAGSTTQHIIWATPTESARPGSVGIPDSPRVTAGPVATIDPSIQANPSFKDSNGSASDATSPDIQIAEDPVAPGDNAGKDGTSFKASPGSPSEQVQQSPDREGETLPNASPGSPLESVQQSLNTDTDPIYHLGKDTLLPGGPAITIKNAPYALNPSSDALISGSKTMKVAESPSAMPALDIKGQSFTADDASHYVVGSKTIIPGGPPVMIDEVVYSLPSSANVLISNDHTMPLAAKSGDSPILTIAGQIVTPDARPGVTLGDHELVAGGSTTLISSTTYALRPSETAFMAGSGTVAGQAHRAGMYENLVASQPRNGDPSYQDGALVFVIGSRTTVLRPSTGKTVAPVITINSTAYTANTASTFMVGAQTLAPGGPALTIGSTVYALPSPPPPLISASSTSLSNPAAGEIVLTVKNSAYTCRQDSPCTIASEILTPNGTITVGADTIVYGQRGIDVIRATMTVVEGSSTLSRGDVITSHIDGLTPIGEETAAAAGPGMGDTEGKGRMIGVDTEKLCIVMGLVLALLVS
ncbi:MAG: hypothetical protein Q9226_007748, partial [Calogaya cf. arnoldii]